MQIPDENVGLESGATVAGISSKPMGPAMSRAEIAGGHTAIRCADPGSELRIRQPEIRPVNFSYHFRTRRDVLSRHGDRV
jgi:hypothetical protein